MFTCIKSNFINKNWLWINEQNLTELETEYNILHEEREWIDWIKKYCKQLELKTSEKDAGLLSYIKGLEKDIVAIAQCGSDGNNRQVQIDTNSK